MGSGAVIGFTLDAATQSFEENIDRSYSGFSYPRLLGASVGVPAAATLLLSPYMQQLGPAASEAINYVGGTVWPGLIGSDLSKIWK